VTFFDSPLQLIPLCRFCGILANAHWKPDVLLCCADWTPKPNAAIWRDLALGKWKTSLSETTTKTGKVETRGHFGKYENVT
jgi:hypothetical protein